MSKTTVLMHRKTVRNIIIGLSALAAACDLRLKVIFWHHLCWYHYSLNKVRKPHAKKHDDVMLYETWQPMPKYSFWPCEALNWVRLLSCGPFFSAISFLVRWFFCEQCSSSVWFLFLKPQEFPRTFTNCAKTSEFKEFIQIKKCY